MEGLRSARHAPRTKTGDPAVVVYDQTISMYDYPNLCDSILIL